MPGKRKNANQMDDRELLRAVFPERVVRRVEEEIGLRNPDETRDSDELNPNKHQSKE